MGRHEQSTPTPSEAIAAWNLTLACLADNDNGPPAFRKTSFVLLLGLPIASTAMVAGCLKLLLQAG